MPVPPLSNGSIQERTKEKDRDQKVSVQEYHVVQWVKQVSYPIFRGYILAAVGPGSNHTGGPLLHVLPPLVAP